MSPKSYFILWGVFALSAGVLFLVGAFSMFTLIIYGFIIFGLIFLGMMNVLPAAVSHPTVERAEAITPKKVFPTPKAAPVKTHSGITAYRAA